jgi:uncharacterized membrane protein (UPF0182 family)
VWTGHLHLVPVGGRLLYVEPIFLAAEADAIPELRRFVVSDGRSVVMEPGLDVALGLLTGKEVALGELELAEPGQAPPGEPSPWPAEALELLDEAERSLREGDYAGFGEALEALRRLLQGAQGRSGG